MNRISIFIAGTLLLANSSIRADLIQNGSFENPDIGNPFYLSATAGSTSIAGWSVSGSGDVALVDAAGTAATPPGYPSFAPAQDGQNYLDLSGATNTAHATIFQDFQTVVGESYLLKFYIGASNQNTPGATINVALNGTGSLLNTYTAPTSTTVLNWGYRSVSFLADSTTTRLSFHDTSSTDDNTSFVDNVSVLVAVPEPSTWAGAAMVVVFSGFSLIRRRQR
jgi:hypothetical protein